MKYNNYNTVTNINQKPLTECQLPPQITKKQCCGKYNSNIVLGPSIMTFPNAIHTPQHSGSQSFYLMHHFHSVSTFLSSRCLLHNKRCYVMKYGITHD